MSTPGKSVAMPRIVLAPTIVMFGIMVAHALLETARDALFLARLGPAQLAYAYLAIAVVAVLAVTIVRRWGGVRDPRRMLIGFLMFAVAGTSVLALLITRSTTAVFVLYVWTGLVATLVVPCFWTVIDRSLQVAEAKRLFATIGAGGVLGALIGSASAATLSSYLPARHLVTAGAIAFALATLIAYLLAPKVTLDAMVRPAAAARTSLRSSRNYLRLLVLVGLVATVTLTLGDLTFKRVLAERLPPEELARVFGTIYTVLNLIGLGVQVIIVPRLLARIGVGGALTVLPLIIMTASLGFFLTGATVAVIALKLGDGGLRYSVHRVATEILFLPLPAGLRDAAKPIVDTVAQRGGQVLAVLVVFIAASVDAGPRTVALLAALVAMGWLATVVLVRRAYARQFRDMLQAGEARRDVHLPDLDHESVDMLVESLSSPDEVEAMAALDLLAQRGGRIPALVLYHPDRTVVRRALGLIDVDVRPDVARVLARLFEHADPGIRTSALAAASRLGWHKPRLIAALDDPDPEVRAVALVGLASDPAHAAAVTAGLALLAQGTIAERCALARAIGYAPNERFRTLLDVLLSTHEPAVMREVLQVLARAPDLARIEQLMLLLADARVRGDARRVLVAFGQRGLDRLIAALDDPRTPLGVRQHLPRTISRFRSRQAAAALVDRLLREPDGTTELKLLRALGRMRADDRTLRIDAASIREYARRVIADAARFSELRDRLAADPVCTPGAELLRELVADKHREAVDHAFRALGILHPSAGLRTVHDAITSTDRTRRSAAREIVEHLVHADLRGPLLAVIDELDPAYQRPAVAADAGNTYERTIAELLTDSSESLRCVVAYHVAERHLVTLRSDLARLRPLAGSPLVLHAFDQAIARLDG